MTVRMLSELTEEAYHAGPGVTFHRLKDFIDGGPKHYHDRHIAKTAPAQPERDWQALGRAYHIYGLQGEDAFRAQVIQHPATYWGKESQKKDAPLVEKPWNWNANDCKAWADEHADRVILSPSEYGQAITIGRNMRANSHAARLLGCGWPEITIEQRDERFPVPVKGRIDWLASTSTKLTDAWAIVDPKGTASLAGFERDAIKLGYWRQLAFYRKLVRDEIGKQLPCFVVAIEKGGACRVRPYQIADDLLDLGEQKNECDLDRLAEHYAGKPWSLDHDDALRVITMPGFLQPGASDAGHEPAPWE